MKIARNDLRHLTMVRHQEQLLLFGVNPIERTIHYRVRKVIPQQAVETDANWGVWRLLPLPNGEGNDKDDSVTNHEPYPQHIRSRYNTHGRSAVAPVQAVSDGTHLYIFRQSIEGTLLVDRFGLNALTNELIRKPEVRFRNSRQRNQPLESSSGAGADQLGFTDANKNPFFEPTTELLLVDELQESRFAVVLAPTSEHGKFRWHIFVQRGDQLAAITLRRSESGLFTLLDDTVFEGDPASPNPRHIPGIIRHKLKLTDKQGGSALAPIDGLSATLFSLQREHVENGETFLVKGSMRVMLAVPTTAERRVAVMSFPLRSDGTLGHISDMPNTSDTLGGSSRPVLLPGDTLRKVRPAAGQELFPSQDSGRPALTFLGGSDLVRIPLGLALQLSAVEDFTVELKLRAETRTGTQTQHLLSFAPGAENSFLFALQYNPGAGYVVARQGGTADLLTAPYRVNDGAFHAVALVRRGGQLTLMVDDHPPVSLPAATTGTGGSPALIVGSGPSGTGGFIGQLAELRIWRRARSQQELKETRDVRLLGRERDLAGYWPMEAMFGELVADLSPAATAGRVLGAYVRGSMLAPTVGAEAKPATAYRNDELVAVRQGATYRESFEFRADREVRELKFLFYGRSSRDGVESKLYPQTAVVEPSGGGWHRASARFTVPVGLTHLRCFAIEAPSGDWAALELRNHAFELLEGSTTEDIYEDELKLELVGTDDTALDRARASVAALERREAKLLEELAWLDDWLSTVDATTLKSQVAELERELENARSELRAAEKALAAEERDIDNYQCQLISRGTGRALDGNSKGELYTLGLGSSNLYQTWEVHRHSFDSEVISLTSVATGRAVDGNSKGEAYARGWNSSNRYQQWRLNHRGTGTHDGKEIDYYSLTSVATGRALDGNSKGEAYTLGWTPDNRYQQWGFIRRQVVGSEISAANDRVNAAHSEVTKLTARLHDVSSNLLSTEGKIKELEGQRDALAQEVRRVQTELTGAVATFMAVAGADATLRAAMPVVHTDAKTGLKVNGAVLGFVTSAGRVTASEGLDGGVQLSYFGTDGRARTCFYSPEAEQWVSDQAPTCLSFDGVDDYVDLGSAIGPGKDKPWTAELWFRATKDPSDKRSEPSYVLYSKAGSYEAAVIDGFLRFRWSSEQAWFGGTRFRVRPGEWYHAAVVFEQGKHSLYRNGELVFTQSHAVSVGRSSAQLLLGARKGTDGTGQEEFFRGQIAQVRMWSLALTPAELFAHAHQHMTGNEPGLEGCWQMGEAGGTALVDATAAADDARSTAPEATSPDGGKAMIYGALWWPLTAPIGRPPVSAVNPKLPLPIEGTESLSTNTFTWEAWVRATGSGVILGRHNSADGTSWLSLAASGGRLILDAKGMQTKLQYPSATDTKTKAPLTGDDWRHVAVSVSEGLTILYLDGEPVASGKDALPAIGGKVSIGSSGQPGSVPLPGQIADVRIWKTARTSSEIRAAMEGRLRSQEPGLLAARPLDDTSTASVIAIDADGKITVGGTPPLPGGGTFTWEAWAQLEPEAGEHQRTRTILAFGSGTEGCLLTINATGMLSFTCRGSSISGGIVKTGSGDSTAPLNDGAWHHLAAVAAAGSVTLYIDGRQAAASTMSLAALPSSLPLTIGGADGGQGLGGRLTEVRIWNTARTPEELLASRHVRLGGEEQGLAAYWPLSRLTGGKVANLLVHDELSSSDMDVVTGGALVAALDLPVAPADTLLCAEYGALEGGSGRRVALLRRSLAFVSGGDVVVLTDRRVEELELRWLGNAQFKPTLLGYIEGPPPVPSENLVLENNYNGATSVELRVAEDVNYSWSRSQEAGAGLDLELAVGVWAQMSAGLIVETSAEFGGMFRADLSAHYKALNETKVSTSVSRVFSDRIELKGAPERKARFGKLGQRFMPKNVGYALVVSALADVFVLRMRRSKKMVAYQVQPVEGVEPDVNTITFMINPAYTLNGTLDGQVGTGSGDERFYGHVPGMRAQYGSLYPASYYRLKEAYDLKQQIDKKDIEREADYLAFNTRLLDTVSMDNNIEMMDENKAEESGMGEAEDMMASVEGQRAVFQQAADGAKAPGPVYWQEKMEQIVQRTGKRNIVNTYVWDADGGLRAESQEFASVIEHTIGSSFDGSLGLGMHILFKAGAAFDLQAMAVLQLTQTMTKSKSTSLGFALDVGVSCENRGITDERDYPLFPGEKVDRYRFMSYYLEPSTANFDHFFDEVVDPEWLASNDEEARALREIDRSSAGKNKTWRVLHRVTYVERPALIGTHQHQLPPDDANDVNSALTRRLDRLEEQLATVLRLLGGQKDESVTLGGASIIEDEPPARTLPLGQASRPDSDALLGGNGHVSASLLGGGDDGPTAMGDGDGAILLGDGPIFGGSSLRVDAGPDRWITFGEQALLEGRVSGKAGGKVTIKWSQQSGPARAEFVRDYLDYTTATFPSAGLYELKLEAWVGEQARVSDTMKVYVNTGPTISAGSDQLLHARFSTEVEGTVVDDGLAEDQGGTVTTRWECDHEAVVFARPESFKTEVVFPGAGAYTLRLVADNGYASTVAALTVTVRARVLSGLQALYSFEDGAGTVTRDVAGTAEPLDLTVDGDPAGVVWEQGALRLGGAALLRSQRPAARVDAAVRAADEVSVEAWVSPGVGQTEGLDRILVIGTGAGERNLTLGQLRGRYHFAIRTRAEDPDGSTTAFSGGSAAAGRLDHVVCTRDATGEARIYLNGELVARRAIAGSCAAWADGAELRVGGEGGDGPHGIWAGALHLAAIYSRALSYDEVRQNFAYGANRNLPVAVEAGPDLILAVGEQGRSLAGRIADDRPSGGLAGATWQVQPANAGLRVLEPANPRSPIELTAKGRFVLTLGASDGELRSSDSLTVVVNQDPEIEVSSQRDVNLPAEARVEWRILDDGLGAQVGEMTLELTQVEGLKARFTAGRLPLNGSTQGLVSIGFPQKGVYHFELAISNGYKTRREPLRFTVHQSPQVVLAAPNGPLVTLPDGLALRATVDDGLGAPQQPASLVWSAEGPGNVTFTPQGEAETTASFGASGEYTLRLTVSNGRLPELSRALPVTANEAPLVDAGPDRDVVALSLPAVVELDGAVSDDGLPTAPGALSLTWSGPQGVRFEPQGAAFTRAHLPGSGSYTLTLTATDGAVERSDSTTIVVHTAPRFAVQAPPAGAREEVILLATLTDDGRGDKGRGTLTHTWEKLSGPGEVRFRSLADAAAAGLRVPQDAGPLSMAAVFEEAGTYRLRLTVDNGAAPGSVELDVAVEARARRDLQALYRFKEDSGRTLLDRSGSGAPINLSLGGGASLREGRLVLSGKPEVVSAKPTASSNPLRRLLDAVGASDELSVEVWMRPSATTLGQGRVAPARILTISKDSHNRNFTLQQGQFGKAEFDFCHVRLRTTTTDANGEKDASGQPLTPMVSAGGLPTDAQLHLVYTRRRDGATSIYVNGRLVAQGALAGSLGSWDESFQLGLGAELNGEYPWSGELHLVALYSRALAADEVARNHGAGH